MLTSFYFYDLTFFKFYGIIYKNRGGLMNYYSEKEMDYFVKINLALIEKFKDQLNAEYGTSFMEVNDMFQKLYEEQNKKMPGMWYEYGYGVKE